MPTGQFQWLQRLSRLCADPAKIAREKGPKSSIEPTTYRPWEQRPRLSNTPEMLQSLPHAPGWRNWQTRETQNLVPSGECGFDSLSGHFNFICHLPRRKSLVVAPAKAGAQTANGRLGPGLRRGDE